MGELNEPEKNRKLSEFNRENQNCFIVMPFGSDAIEQRWFKGWYQSVIEPAVRLAGYNPVLAANEHNSNAINDEIRSHLAFDPMVVVDLGGVQSSDQPNPNVMYELGIRHAFGLPLVIMAWDGQKLPFDVSNQRAIMGKRDFLEIESTRQKLVAFIEAAETGNYYKPMEAVARIATIEQSAQALGEDSLLGALANEVRDLRSTLEHRPAFSWKKLRNFQRIKGNINRELRAELWKRMRDRGVEGGQWGSFLGSPVTEDAREQMSGWTIDDWEKYCTEIITDIAVHPTKSNLPEELIKQVENKLPVQPWPQKIHESVAAEIGIEPRQVSKAIKELIRRGRFNDQIDGKIVVSGAST